MEAFKVLLLAIAAAVVYGVVHDQITARICVEYFTVGHAPIFNTEDPTTLGLGWGVLATWWAGLLLGLPLALIAAAGSRPKVTARDLLEPVAVAMACVGVLALAAGLAGYLLARAGLLRLAGPLAANVPAAKHAAFLADACAHAASYGGGCLAALILWRWAAKRREALGRQALPAEPDQQAPFPS